MTLVLKTNLSKEQVRAIRIKIEEIQEARMERGKVCKDLGINDELDQEYQTYLNIENHLEGFLEEFRPCMNYEKCGNITTNFDLSGACCSNDCWVVKC